MQGYVACGLVQRRPYRARLVLGLCNLGLLFCLMVCVIVGGSFAFFSRTMVLSRLLFFWDMCRLTSFGVGDRRL